MTQYSKYLRINHRWSKIPLEDRFVSKIEKTEDCWFWTSAKDKAGYGYFKVGSRKTGFKIVLAHRFSFKFHNGEFDEKFDVLHKCDVRHCVNPNHLFLGTHSDNMNDAKNKNRMTGARGEKQHSAKLSEMDVLNIRKKYASGMTILELSSLYKVCKSNISHITTRRNWKHI